MSNLDKSRWLQRLESFESAMKQLDSACNQRRHSDLERAGLIQIYEFSFELSWKTLSDLLFIEGIEANSPRQVIRESYAMGYIEDVDTWLEALESRNRLAHTYDQTVAEAAKKLIQQRYAPLLAKVLNQLQQHRGEQ